MRCSREGMRCSRVGMRCSLAARASDSQCRSRSCPGFDPSILRHSVIWGAADEAVLNKVLWKEEKIHPVYLCKDVFSTKSIFHFFCISTGKFSLPPSFCRVGHMYFARDICPSKIMSTLISADINFRNTSFPRCPAVALSNVAVRAKVFTPSPPIRRWDASGSCSAGDRPTGPPDPRPGCATITSGPAISSPGPDALRTQRCPPLNCVEGQPRPQPPKEKRWGVGVCTVVSLLSLL